MKNRNYPKCPYCDFEYDDELMWEGKEKVYVGECDESELTCPDDDCGKTFKVRCDHEYIFTTVDEDGDEFDYFEEEL